MHFLTAAGLFLALAASAFASDREAVRAIERTMPAVLSITTYLAGKDTEGGRPNLREAEIDNVASGFFIDKEGHLITNAHVLEAGQRLRVLVTTQEGLELEARPVAVDKQADLALLKVEAPEGTRFKSLSLKKLSPNRLGQTVIALGNPVGYGNSISKGVLSATNRSVSLDGMLYEGLLQTDAAINPGSSGGPIVDLDGRLVGVSSVKLAFDEAGMPLQGIGFAIPAERVASVLQQMEAPASGVAAIPAPSGSQRGFLTSWLPGFGGNGGSSSARHLTVPKALEQLGIEVALPRSGDTRTATQPPVVADIYLNSPAEYAGLKPGERIFRVGRLKLDIGNDFTRATLPSPGTEPLELEVGAIVEREGRFWKQVRLVQLAVPER
jgi:serine protease Do